MENFWRRALRIDDLRVQGGVILRLRNASAAIWALHYVLDELWPSRSTSATDTIVKTLTLYSEQHAGIHAALDQSENSLETWSEVKTLVGDRLVRARPRLSWLVQSPNERKRHLVFNPFGQIGWQGPHLFVFNLFPPSLGPVREGHVRSFLGVEEEREALSSLAPGRFLFQGALGENTFMDWPVLDEEYFEWAAVLEAAAIASSRSWSDGARSGFAMAEIGSGLAATWGIRAAVAFHRLAPPTSPCLLLAVEPDWASASQDSLRHALDINIPSQRCRMVTEAAPMKGDLLPSLAEVLDRAMGRRSRWDLVDLDCQECELLVVREELPELASRALRLHLSTHSRAIHQEALGRLRAAGWAVEVEYAWNSAATVGGLGPFVSRDGHITARPPL